MCFCVINDSWCTLVSNIFWMPSCKYDFIVVFSFPTTQMWWNRSLFFAKNEKCGFIIQQKLHKFAVYTILSRHSNLIRKSLGIDCWTCVRAMRLMNNESASWISKVNEMIWKKTMAGRQTDNLKNQKRLYGN